MNDTRADIIETVDQVHNLVDYIVSQYVPPLCHLPILYVDLEGVNLCREGSASIPTLLIDFDGPARRVCLIDIHLLGARAFKTAGAKQKTMKDIFQNENIAKSKGVDLASWKSSKEKGKQLFKTKHEGATSVFNQRPIVEDIVMYCVGDVQYLPELRKRFLPESYEARAIVNEETKKRLVASQKPD
ncbi:hypothetical protein EKO04_008075 [Ascochyta lentis]|uniref:3'-5' exonuclease domain-containing protein n=1 Tax=Ascochyta lentis TaxID=205686 RepID=A0A8H7IZL9_9PLEO|nr:hypothetical protein EKO04_008075 [Ascochyta lentis]